MGSLADVGEMVGDDGIDGYRGDLNPNTVTIAEALKTGGYCTYMSGKWHVSNNVAAEGPKHSWPLQRGFDDFYGIITGAASYYQPRTLTRNNEAIEPEGDDYFLTDAISDEAVRQIREHAAGKAGSPFFQYVAYTAPHWPLHAHEDDIARYKSRFDAGWDRLREANGGRSLFTWRRARTVRRPMLNSRNCSNSVLAGVDVSQRAVLILICRSSVRMRTPLPGHGAWTIWGG